MSQDAKQHGVVMHRKVQLSDVRWRDDVRPVRRNEAKRVIADPVVEPMTEDELMQDMINDVAKGQQSLTTQKKMRKHSQKGFGIKKIALAFVVAVIVMIGIVHLVNMSTPDVSLKMTAMQNGINAIYPEYTPRGYALSDITSENGKVTLNFKNAENGASYSLVEENVNNVRLLNEYVDSVFGEEYVKLDEHGTVVYIGDGGAAWMNGGVLFKLKITSGSLTRKQIMSIATTK